MFAFTMRESVERCSGASHGRSFLTRGRDFFHVIGFWVSQALELVQDSKATIFLVLELARGGELFDRIKVGRDAWGRCMRTMHADAMLVLNIFFVTNWYTVYVFFFCGSVSWGRLVLTPPSPLKGGSRHA